LTIPTKKKLGVLVAYLVDDDFVWMLKMHLNYIVQNTKDVEFKIYGAQVKLSETALQVLQGYDDVELVDIPPTPKKKSEEHAYFLDHLADAAIAQGCTHIATFDVDSFPVKKNWFSDLWPRLTEQKPVIAVSREELGDIGLPHPCGILCDVAFHKAASPQFLPDNSKAEMKFRHARKLRRDTGIGYAVALHARGLDWTFLLKTNDDTYGTLFGTVYGDIFFHLGGGAPFQAGLTRWQFIQYKISRRLSITGIFSGKMKALRGAFTERRHREKKAVVDRLRNETQRYFAEITGRDPKEFWPAD
jgi:hypothetical protein